MKTTPSALSPLEAYEALMLFARRRGEGALRLAMHAAVPQSFRPDLLHLLKLNFLPRELHDPAAESDVLFSPLCEEVGRGYFEFGPHVRSLLLDNLAANYAADRTPRIARVANFLLFYVEHAERRAAGGLDRLRRDYLEVQRWVALAFLDPDDAARQLAAALKGTSPAGGEFAARLRLGGLASALSSPLVKYRHVLNYAAGLQALEAGDHARAQTLLSGLGDEQLNVGGILLRPASDLLRDYNVQRPEPPPTETVSTPEPSHAKPPKVRIFLSYAREDRERVEEAYRRLRELGHEPWVDFASVQPGEPWEEAVRAASENADAVIFFLSQNSSRKIGHLQRQIRYALMRMEESNFLIIPALLEPSEIPPELASYNAVDLSSEEGWRRLEEALDWVLKPTAPRSEDEEREEKIKYLESLAGSDDPQALETLADAIWSVDDSRARLAAVRALSRGSSERALEALLAAAGDVDAEVAMTAAKALAGAGVNAVLIFGFFGTDHVENREVLSEELRRRGYVPLLFPFTRPLIHDTAAIARGAAPITRFAVADLTAPPEIRDELGGMLEIFLSQTSLPLVLIHQGITLSKLPLDLRRQHPSVLPLYSYAGPGELREAFDRAVMEPVSALLHGRQADEAVEDFDALFEDASSLEEAGELETALVGYERAESAAESEEHKLAARKARTDLLEKMERFEEVLKVYEQAIQITPHDEELHLGRARTLERLGLYADAMSNYETAASLARRTSTFFNSAVRRALLGQGRCFIKLGLFGEALALLTESRRPMEEHGHPSDLAELLIYMGQVSTGLHRFDDARRHYEQSLTTYRKLGDRLGEVGALNGLGHLMQISGDVEGAGSALRESLRILRELGDQRGAARALINLGGTLADGGSYVEAEDVLTQASKTLSEVGDKSGEAAAYIALGAMYSKSGRLSEALSAYHLVLELSPDNVDAIHGRDEVMKKMTA